MHVLYVCLHYECHSLIHITPHTCAVCVVSECVCVCCVHTHPHHTALSVISLTHFFFQLSPKKMKLFFSLLYTFRRLIVIWTSRQRAHAESSNKRKDMLCIWITRERDDEMGPIENDRFNDDNFGDNEVIARFRLRSVLK